MKRTLALILAIFLAVLTGQAGLQQQNCTSSNTTTWTSSPFANQTLNFCTAPFTITPSGTVQSGAGGPVVGVSAAAISTTGSPYAQNAALIRQSENGYWEVWNGATGGYAHDNGVQWVVQTAAVFTWCFNFAAQTSTVQISQVNSSCAGTCTLASSYKFRAAANNLSFWNLDNPSNPLSVCNFAVATPVPTISSVVPAAGTWGTSVVISGANFGTSQGNSVISFGGVAATTVSAWNNTAISATVPNTATTGNIIVTVGNQVSNGFPFSITPGVPPAPPQLVSVSSVSNVALSCGPATPPPAQHSVTLTWTASNSTGVTGYNIYKSSVNGSAYTKIASTGPTVLNYVDTAVLAGQSYYYVVTATNATLESTWSNQAGVSLP